MSAAFWAGPFLLIGGAVADVLAREDAFGAAGIRSQGADQRVDAVKRWLSSLEGWLLVLDNADDIQMHANSSRRERTVM